nr:hypothetical protein pmam_133 [Pithovirus mammoth]
MGKLQISYEFSIESKQKNCNLVANFWLNLNRKIAIWLRIFIRQISIICNYFS